MDAGCVNADLSGFERVSDTFSRAFAQSRKAKLGRRFAQMNADHEQLTANNPEGSGFENRIGFFSTS